jgi:hypothetical protein
VKDDDPYSKVKDDLPYSRVREDDPYNQVEGDVDSDSSIKENTSPL